MLIRVMPIAAAAIAAIAIGSASPANAQPLQPGPHSAIADIDLPEGTVPCTSSGCRTPPEREEVWRYTAPYGDTAAFLHDRLANGPRNGLPPCYDINHPSSQWGQIGNDTTEWTWSNDARWLAVAVVRPGLEDADGGIASFGRIYIACGPVNPPEPKGRCFHAYSHG
jgi:hypothetical protein